ncbi:MAG TPA: J domain-containing protein [Pirellulales bacterium]
MKDSDAKSPVLKADWFRDRASSKTLGKGMGPALADWESYCTDCEKFHTEREFQEAFDAIDRMRKAIKKADDECNKLLQKSTKLCLKNYLALVKRYEQKLEMSYEMWKLAENVREKEEREAEEEAARAKAKAKAKQKKADEQDEAEFEEQPLDAKDVALLKKHLGLNWPNVKRDEVKAAWRKFSLANHPDRTQGDLDKQKTFQEVSAAHDRLNAALRD